VRPLIGMFPDADHPDVLVGLGAVDDAAVYRLGGGRVAVITLDFFPPVVDDPFDFGAIAAANSMSDVWAMGADPVLALNIALFPNDMPPEVGARILEGAALQVREAGAVIAGGHTMDNKDPVFGMAVVGMARSPR
jgi:selenide,water dikinase